MSNATLLRKAAVVSKKPFLTLYMQMRWSQHSCGSLLCHAEAPVRTSHASLRAEVFAEKSYSQALLTRQEFLTREETFHLVCSFT